MSVLTARCLRLFCAFGLVLAPVVPAQAAATAWQLDPARSQVRFVIQQMGVPVEGGFARFQLQVQFDPARPEASRFRIDLDTASIDTGSAEGDVEARRPMWFDVARHPRASFVSRSVQRVGEGRFVAHGDLTIKGRTQAIQVPFTLTRQGAGHWLAEGRLPVSRAAFGIGGGEWDDVVADRAEARFRLWLRP